MKCRSKFQSYEIDTLVKVLYDNKLNGLNLEGGNCKTSTTTHSFKKVNENVLKNADVSE